MYKELVSFLWVDGEWIGARNKQIAREPRSGSRDLFFPRSNSFPFNKPPPPKKKKPKKKKKKKTHTP